MLEKADYLKIGKPAWQCIGCGQSLAGYQRHVSTLLLPEEGEQKAEDKPAEGSKASPVKATDKDHAPEEPAFNRCDYCPDCWDRLKQQAYFSFWMGKHDLATQPTRKIGKIERNLALAALFDSFMERRDEGDKDYAPHLFFLAHLLMKFKIFKWLPCKIDPQNGAVTLRFHKVQTDEEVKIPDMEMPDELIVKIKDEIENYLQEATGQPIKI